MSFNPGSSLHEKLTYRRISLSAEPGMRVGEEFQAAIPELMSESKFIF